MPHQEILYVASFSIRKISQSDAGHVQPVLPHRETAGAKLFEGNCRVRVVAAPREVAGTGLGQHRQVDAKESVSKMCGTEQGQIQLQKVPWQEGQDGSASEQAKGLR